MSNAIKIMDKERSIKYNRFLEAFDYLKETGRITSKKELADILHKTPETISRVFSGKANNPNDRFLLDFARAFADIISEDYILHGKGTLLKEQSSFQQETEKEQTDGDMDIVVRFLKQLESKDKTISFLRDQLSRKDKEIERLYAVIDSLSPVTEKKKDSQKTAIV